MSTESDAGEPPPAAGDSEVDDGGGGGRVLEWELGLPSADDLIPLSHSLISPELASAFRISPPTTPPHTILDVHRASNTTISLLRSFPHPSGDDDIEPESPARKLHRTAEEADSTSIRLEAASSKRPRLVWTAQLHKRFVDVVSHLGVGNAVPKTIMQMMNVEGLTRENVASHLQKYRLYLKKGQGVSMEGGGRELNSTPTAAQEPYAPPMQALPPFGSIPFSGYQGGIEQRYHVYGAFGQDWPGGRSFGSMSSCPPRVVPK